MIKGRVLDLHALLNVTFRILDQPDINIECVVDTGFTGALALPPAAVRTLALPYLGELSANMANDMKVVLSVYAATIIWNGFEQEVRVLATGRRPLIGTALLNGNELFVQFAEGGLVTVESL